MNNTVRTERNISSADDTPVRVLLTTGAANRPGGVGQYMRSIRPYLGENVHHFAIGSRADNEPLAASLLRIILDSWGFARTLRHGRYDLVHLNPSIAFKALLRDGLLLLISKALRKPVLVFAHGWDDVCERVVLKYLCWLFRLVYGRADAFIVLGECLRNRLRHLGYKRTVFVHSAPIEDGLFNYCLHFPVRRPIAANSRPFTILFLSRIEREKGIFEALDAFHLLKQHRFFVSLVVAGSGRDLESAKQYADARGLIDVTFLGHVEGTAKYAAFRGAHAYLFPSYYGEGLPISVLEAMAAGLPVITRRVGAIAEFFLEGQMGFITDSRSPQVMAALLTRLIEDPNLSSAMGLFNQKYARDHFNAPQIAGHIHEVYRFLLRSPNQTLLLPR